MTCPHCSASLTRKQRSNRTCDLCKKEFAFEPKTHVLGLNDVRFRRTAERLGVGGTRYTASQLRLAVSRKAPSIVSPWISCLALGFFGVITALVSAKLGAQAPGVIAAVVITSIAVLFVLNRFRRPASMSDEAFQREALSRWRAVHGKLPAGLLDEAALAGLAEAERPRQELAGVVVCPERDVLSSLLANDVPKTMRLGLLGTTPPVEAWEKEVLELLRKDSRLPVFLLHDSSAEGVFLARDLPQLLGLNPRHLIYDLGLNPKKSIEKKRYSVVRPVPKELVARLEREAVGADVAGARPIRRGRAQVSPEELAWLKAGNCAPILAVPPASLIKRLRFALDKVKARPRLAAAKAEPGAEAAAALGFMSEPA